MLRYSAAVDGDDGIIIFAIAQPIARGSAISISTANSHTGGEWRWGIDTQNTARHAGQCKV